MAQQTWLEEQANLTLERLLPRIMPLLKKRDAPDVFEQRLRAQFPRLFALLHQLYGDQYDFFYYLEQILTTAAQQYAQRPKELKALDAQREADPTWFESEKMLGAVCYVDLFAGTLAGLKERLPYFKELGVTYLHLMPLFKVPLTNNDGGYAVSDYRTVNPTLGTMDELRDLTAEFRAQGISLVLDFVFNHTSNEHEWAQRAIKGEARYRRFYHMFPNREMPDQYEQHLRVIFPEQAPGNFTYQEDIDQWVWTTFYDFQWDLNYRNPDVFNAMLGEMLFLANQGVEVLRLDAVAFLWKQLGTSSENLPQAHWIIQAYNALTKIVAPAVLFKSEAIVHPHDVASYISPEEAPISYNPTLMALIWEALATRKVELLYHSMRQLFDLQVGCAWVNYLRVHDDIGWTFADEDAWGLGINAFDHRQFLNQFYTGRFSGSFAKGVGFGFNPVNQDMRIAGMLASLAGLEQALELQDEAYIEMALRRIEMMYSIIFSAGGIPLIYMGDEIAMLNDYSYQTDPIKRTDARWVHRLPFDWQRAETRHDPETLPGRIYTALKRLIDIRKQTPAFAGNAAHFFDTGNPHVLGYIRSQRVVVLANFSEQQRAVHSEAITERFPVKTLRDLVTGDEMTLKGDIMLAPYGYRWLERV